MGKCRHKRYGLKIEFDERTLRADTIKRVTCTCPILNYARYTLKLAPHPQVVVAFGFCTKNREPSKPST